MVAAELDHTRAVALAEQAREGFRSVGKGNRDEVAAETAWLAEQDPDTAWDESL
jgi:hypothetical protein